MKKTRGEIDPTKHIASSSFLAKLEISCVLSIGTRKLISCLCYISGAGLGRFHGFEILPVKTYEKESEN